MIKNILIIPLYALVIVLSVFIVNAVLSQGHCKLFTNPVLFGWINFPVFLMWSLIYPLFYYFSIRKILKLFKTRSEHINLEFVIWLVLSNIMSPLLFFDLYTIFLISFENYL